MDRSERRAILLNLVEALRAPKPLRPGQAKLQALRQQRVTKRLARKQKLLSTKKVRKKFRRFDKARRKSTARLRDKFNIGPQDD